MRHLLYNKLPNVVASIELIALEHQHVYGAIVGDLFKKTIVTTNLSVVQTV